MDEPVLLCQNPDCAKREPGLVLSMEKIDVRQDEADTLEIWKCGECGTRIGLMWFRQEGSPRDRGDFMLAALR